MGQAALNAAGSDQLTVLADRGYYNREQVLECEGTGVRPCVPKVDTSGRAQRGFFARPDFIYDPTHDHYTCPAGAYLTKGKTLSNHKGDIDHYRNLSACHACELRPRCTPEKIKRVKRWTHEAVLDAMPLIAD